MTNVTFTNLNRKIPARTLTRRASSFTSRNSCRKTRGRTRAGWAHASAADHRPLLAYLRYNFAYVEYWRGRPSQSRDLALSGLEYVSEGKRAAELHLQYAKVRAELAAPVFAGSAQARELGEQIEE